MKTSVCAIGLDVGETKIARHESMTKNLTEANEGNKESMVRSVLFVSSIAFCESNCVLQT